MTQRKNVAPKLIRRPLFRGDTSRDGWQREMLVALAAARRMGFVNFEIVLHGDPAPLPKPKMSEASSALFAIAYITDDDWKISKAKDVTADCVVDVYAVMVEDVG